MLVQVDMPTEQVEKFRAFCVGQGGMIEINGCVENGPAGGNPCFSLGVHSFEALAALGRFYFGE